MSWSNSSIVDHAEKIWACLRNLFNLDSGYTQAPASPQEHFRFSHAKTSDSSSSNHSIDGAVLLSWLHTTALQLAALAWVGRHKASQWRTTVRQRCSTARQVQPNLPPTLSLRRESLFQSYVHRHVHAHTPDDNDAVSLGGGRCWRSAQISSLCCREQGLSYCSTLAFSHLSVTSARSKYYRCFQLHKIQENSNKQQACTSNSLILKVKNILYLPYEVRPQSPPEK